MWASQSILRLRVHYSRDRPMTRPPRFYSALPVRIDQKRTRHEHRGGRVVMHFSAGTTNGRCRSTGGPGGPGGQGGRRGQPLDLPGIQGRHFLKLRQSGISFLAAAGLRTHGEDRFEAPE